MRRIFISAGHCGPKENGSIDLLNEKKETIRIVNALHEYLKNDTDVMYATNQKLRERIDFVNFWCERSGLAIEFHFNKTNRKSGTECFVANNARQESKNVAQELSQLVADTLSIYNRGPKYERQSYLKKLGFVSETSCPAVIVEVCFLDNADDVKKYNDNFDKFISVIGEYIKLKMQ